MVDISAYFCNKVIREHQKNQYSVAAENAINNVVHVCCFNQLQCAGHMPKEQANRQPSPASNVYALGCLVFFVLTGRMPAQFASEKLRTSFEREIGVTPKMSKLLQCLLEPVAEDRPTASQVRSVKLWIILPVN
jgi:serine/threonine protein kinase